MESYISGAAIKRVLVIAAHPDDEVLGCGGTIANFTNFGNQVKCIFTADGVGARYEDTNNPQFEQELVLRKSSAKEASRILSCEDPVFMDYPDNRLDSVDLINIVKDIEKIILEFQPDLILTHHAGDLNIDHRITSQAVVTATRPASAYQVNEIWFFETLSSTEWMMPSLGMTFDPNIFVSISETLESKIEALKAYDQEMRKFPHPRSEESITALANWRGSNANLMRAESFILGKKIIGEL